MWTVPRFATPIVLVVLGCQHPMPAREQRAPGEHAPFLQDTMLGVVHHTAGREFDLSNKAARDSLRAVVVRERDAWMAAGAHRPHQFLLRQQCFCPAQRGWILMQVSENRVRAWDASGKPIRTDFSDVLSIDQLFMSLESLLGSDKTVVSIAFDPNWHFPTYFRTSIARLPDSWSITEIRGFRWAGSIQDERRQALLELKRWRDSLEAGRRRWSAAAVASYALQTHLDCNCLSMDTLGPLVLTVKDGAVVSRTRGKGPRAAIDLRWTVDSLFSYVAEDIGGSVEEFLRQTTGIDTLPDRYIRRVLSLDLHPVYGIPMYYSAETPGIMDVEVTVVVDSFAVFSKRQQ